jgi:pimeloyl-ACP methyl ester carboxylesterase
MSKQSANKFYQGVSQKEIEKYREFTQTHQRKRLNRNGQEVEYLAGGKGDMTILLPPGGFGILPPEYGFRSILHFEQNYKVIAPDVRGVSSLDEVCELLNRILDAEGVGKVIPVGGSGAGISAQSYFKRNFARVQALVLYNTVAPKDKQKKNRLLQLIPLLPGFILRALFIKKADKLLEAEIPAEAQDRVRFSAALLKEMFFTGFNKKELLFSLKLATQFLETDGYKVEDFKDWKGKVLVITAEDDPGFKDAEDLVKNLPHSRLYTFPKGSGHLAPLIYPGKFFGLIDDFLAEFNTSGQ